MKWRGDNIQQTLKLFVFSILKVLAYEQILSLREFHDLWAGNDKPPYLSESIEPGQGFTYM